MFTDEFKVKVRESNEKGKKKRTWTEKIKATVRVKRTEEEK